MMFGRISTTSHTEATKGLTMPSHHARPAAQGRLRSLLHITAIAILMILFVVLIAMAVYGTSRFVLDTGFIVVVDGSAS
jgi:hypothetical protein